MTAPPPKAPPPELELLHQDEHLVVVNKPAGFIVHRGWANDRVTVMSALRDQIGRRVWPVHRLDRMTSGALAFVTSTEALRPLMSALEERSDTIDKRYIALVRGRPGEGGLIDYAVPRTEKGERVPAQTEWRLLHQIDHYALVEAKPLSGRLHQIRRHFKHLNHPIVWDRKHGRGRFNARCRADFGIDRMALHARRLTLPHPIDERTITVTAGVPSDLGEPFERMGLPREHWA